MTEDRLEYVAAKVVRSRLSPSLLSLREGESLTATGLKQLLSETFAAGDEVVILKRSDFDTLHDIFQEMK